MSVLALIPARAGSKGLKNKNIKILSGHPLISYSIKAGIQTKMIDRVVCSTDSKKVADIALKYGAEVPFLRPKKYSTDDSRDIDFVMHAIEFLKVNENYIPELIVLLRPTAPIRKISEIDQAIEIMNNNPHYDSLKSVYKAKSSPYKMWKINNNLLKPLLRLKNDPEPYNSPRQNLPVVYSSYGHIEIISYKSLIMFNSVSGRTIYPFIMDSEQAVDIDTGEDLELADTLLKFQ